MKNSKKQHSFTIEYLNSLPNAKEGKRYMIYDKTIPQLAIRVTDKGIKSFIIQRRLNSRVIKTTIGRYPEMKINKAREKATKILSDFSDNINPNDQKNRLREEITLKELYNEYMTRYSKKHKKTWKHDEADIPRFFGHWFNRKISDISKHNILKLHEEITEKNGVYQANRTLDRIKSMYTKAIEWGWDGVNPAKGIKKNKEIQRERFILSDEFPRFFEALELEQNISAKNYIKMSLYTGARKSNVLAMRWEDIDFTRQIWYIKESKNGEPLSVPLLPPAINLLRSIKKINEWVFPSKDSKTGHLQDPKSAWKRILKQAGIEDLRLHDIRRTLGSYQAITGSSLPIIGKSLGHKTQSATQVYARLSDDPVRESMNKAINKMLEYKGDSE